MNETAKEVFSAWSLLVTVLFIALNGFFVAAEFALVKVRPSHIAALAKGGNRRAGIILKMQEQLDLYLSACQLGVTLSSLILGWLAEPAIATLLIKAAGFAGWEVTQQAWLHPLALAIALAVVTVAHMTIGEQTPKIWSIRRTDTVALLVAWPLRAFTLLFKPVIWVVNRISSGILVILGVPSAAEHEGVYDVAELRMMLEASAKVGNLTPRQHIIGENVLALASLEVRHIMVPRIDVAFLSREKSDEANLKIVRDAGHSRYPLGGPDLDKVEGMIHSRDLLRELLDGRTPDLRTLVRKCLTVPDTQPLSRLILDLQHSQTQSALVIDEHGTMVGLAFLEDALEEIVGPIHDEFDDQEVRINALSAELVELTGAVPLPDASNALGIALDDEDDSIAGLVVSRLGRLPKVGDELTIGPYKTTVLCMSRGRITRLRFERNPEDAVAEQEQG